MNEWMPKEMMIRYDRKDRRLTIYAMLIWPASILLFFIFHTLENWIKGDGIELITACLFLLAVQIGPILFIVMLSKLVECTAYFKRLDRHAYLIPEDKKEYGSLLQNLPRGYLVNTPATSRECEIFSVVYAAISVIMFAFSVWHFLICNGCLGNSRYILFAIWNGFTLMVIYHACRCNWEKDNSRYCDDVELDPDRILRHHPL